MQCNCSNKAESISCTTLFGSIGQLALLPLFTTDHSGKREKKTDGSTDSSHHFRLTETKPKDFSDLLKLQGGVVASPCPDAPESAAFRWQKKKISRITRWPGTTVNRYVRHAFAGFLSLSLGAPLAGRHAVLLPCGCLSLKSLSTLSVLKYLTPLTF